MLTANDFVRTDDMSTAESDSFPSFGCLHDLQKRIRQKWLVMQKTWELLDSELTEDSTSDPSDNDYLVNSSRHENPNAFLLPESGKWLVCSTTAIVTKKKAQSSWTPTLTGAYQPGKPISTASASLSLSLILPLETSRQESLHDDQLNLKGNK